MNRGHEIGCPALRGGVPCACWVPAKALTQEEMKRRQYLGCAHAPEATPWLWCWPCCESACETERDQPLGDITHILGRPLRYWIDVDQQLKLRGYDRLLDGYYEAHATMRLNIRQLEQQNRALEIEWHGLQQMADDQRKTLIALVEEMERTGQASPWD